MSNCSVLQKLTKVQDSVTFGSAVGHYKLSQRSVTDAVSVHDFVFSL